MTARQNDILRIARVVADRHGNDVITAADVVEVALELGIPTSPRFITDAKRVARHLRYERATGTLRNLTIEEN